MSQSARRTIRASALLLLSAGGVVWHTSSRGEAELAAGQAALVAGELELSVRHAGRAAAAYVPGAAHVDAAHALLRTVALDAEREANGELARSAWQAMRSAAWTSSHVWRPRAVELELASANLARLGGFSSAAAAGLLAPPLPLWPRSLLALGFVGALGALSWFCRCAWAESGSWRLARAAGPALAWCAGALVLGWALLHA